MEVTRRQRRLFEVACAPAHVNTHHPLLLPHPLGLRMPSHALLRSSLALVHRQHGSARRHNSSINVSITSKVIAPAGR